MPWSTLGAKIPYRPPVSFQGAAKAVLLGSSGSKVIHRSNSSVGVLEVASSWCILWTRTRGLVLRESFC